MGFLKYIYFLLKMNTNLIYNCFFDVMNVINLPLVYSSNKTYNNKLYKQRVKLQIN